MVGISNYPALAALLVAVTICGCATILKGPKAEVDLFGPDSVRITRMNGIPVPITQHEDSSKFIRPQVLNFLS